MGNDEQRSFIVQLLITSFCIQNVYLKDVDGILRLNDNEKKKQKEKEEMAKIERR